MLLASSVYARLPPQYKPAVDPAECQLIINDELKADVAKPEPTPDLFVFSHEAIYPVLFNDIDGPGKRDFSLREIDRPATGEPESNPDGNIRTSRLRSNAESFTYTQAREQCKSVWLGPYDTML